MVERAGVPTRKTDINLLIAFILPAAYDEARRLLCFAGLVPSCTAGNPGC